MTTVLTWLGGCALYLVLVAVVSGFPRARKTIARRHRERRIVAEVEQALRDFARTRDGRLFASQFREERERRRHG